MEGGARVAKLGTWRSGSCIGRRHEQGEGEQDVGDEQSMRRPRWRIAAKTCAHPHMEAARTRVSLDARPRGDGEVVEPRKRELHAALRKTEAVQRW
jgi:hypothetical protein